MKRKQRYRGIVFGELLPLVQIRRNIGGVTDSTTTHVPVVTHGQLYLSLVELPSPDPFPLPSVSFSSTGDV